MQSQALGPSECFVVVCQRNCSRARVEGLHVCVERVFRLAGAQLAAVMPLDRTRRAGGMHRRAAIVRNSASIGHRAAPALAVCGRMKLCCAPAKYGMCRESNIAGQPQLATLTGTQTHSQQALQKEEKEGQVAVRGRTRQPVRPVTLLGPTHMNTHKSKKWEETQTLHAPDEWPGTGTAVECARKTTPEASCRPGGGSATLTALGRPSATRRRRRGTRSMPCRRRHAAHRPVHGLPSLASRPKETHSTPAFPPLSHTSPTLFIFHALPSSCAILSTGLRLCFFPHSFPPTRRFVFHLSIRQPLSCNC